MVQTFYHTDADFLFACSRVHYRLVLLILFWFYSSIDFFGDPMRGPPTGPGRLARKTTKEAAGGVSRVCHEGPQPPLGICWGPFQSPQPHTVYYKTRSKHQCRKNEKRELPKVPRGPKLPPNGIQNGAIETLRIVFPPKRRANSAKQNRLGKLYEINLNSKLKYNESLVQTCANTFSKVILNK